MDEALIDDFEDGNGALLDVAGRVGHWSTANDGTGTQTPAAGTSPSPVAGGANGSGYAMHTTGSGFSDWGAGLQIDLNNPGNGAASRLPYDASGFDGVRFFARGSGTVRVEFVVRGVVESNAGGTCTTGCYDAHGFSIELGSEWQEYVVGFSQVAQESWGTEVNFSPSDLLAINFKMLSLASFDFWLDDLKFADPGSAPGPAGPGPGPGPGSEPVEPEPPPGPVNEPGMCGGGNLKSYNGNGSVTYYTFAMGSSEVNCSYQITGNNPDRVANIFTGEGRYFGAMNTSDYNNAAMCGGCVEVTRDGGRSVVITIVDQCPVATNPKCTAGHIDLSLEAFRQIGQDQEGHIGTGNGGAVGSISWKYVPCPVDATNVKYKLKEPNRMDWNELLVQSHRYPISGVEIDGRPATRKSYNYWEPPSNMGAGPWRVKVTDVMGGVIESTVERSGGDMDSGLQFTCQ